MWSVFGADDKAESHSVGKDWFDEFRKRLSPETLEVATRASRFGELWVALLPIVETAPDRSIDAALAWLEASDPIWLREALLSEKFCDVSPDIRAAAARGEDEAVAAVLAEANTMKMEETFCKSLESFLELPADEVIPPLVEALRRVRSEAFAEYEEEWAAAQSRDAATRQPMIDSATSTKDLIESITNGIAYDLPQGVRRIVFVPSVSLRPWTLITDHDDALLICYPVSDEHLVLDPEAPPSSLLAVYKALGDDKRMRLLRKLSEGPATLDRVDRAHGHGQVDRVPSHGGASSRRIGEGPVRRRPGFDLRPSPRLDPRPRQPSPAIPESPPRANRDPSPRSYLMSAMMFAYVQARQTEIEAASRSMDAPWRCRPCRDRLGRTLIAWGEQLVTVPPPSPGVSMRSAA